MTTNDKNGDKPTVEESDDVLVAEPEAAEAAAPPAQRDGILRRGLRGARAKAAVLTLTAVFLASAGIAAWLYVNQYRPDQQTGPAAAKVVLDAATQGTVALLSYSPENLDRDFATAKSHLTGEFLSYYAQFTDQIVKPAAQQKAVTTSATVVRSAVSEIRPDSAVVLLFVNQMTNSDENPGGALAASSVRVEMKKIDGAWLISSFDPV